MNAWLPLAIVLVVIGGLIASAETALTRISRVRAEEYARDGRRGSARLQAIVNDPPRYLNLLLLLRLSCELVATVIATLLFIDLLHDQGWAYVWAAVVMIVISYVVVGVMPRTLGRQHAEPVALASAPIVYGLTRIFAPCPSCSSSSATRSRPARVSATARSPRRPSCVTWSTWPRSAG